MGPRGQFLRTAPSTAKVLSFISIGTHRFPKNSTFLLVPPNGGVTEGGKCKAVVLHELIFSPGIN